MEFRTPAVHAAHEQRRRRYLSLNISIFSERLQNE